MKTRHLLGALALATVIAAPAAAQSQHSGTWKSNHAKSYWSDGKFPPNFSLTVKMTWTPDKLVYSSVNDTDKAKPMGLTWESKLDDSVGPLAGSPRFNEIRIKKLSANEFQVLEQQNGDVIVGQYWMFAKDGKSLARWGVGKAPDGKSKAFYEWFDRVK